MVSIKLIVKQYGFDESTVRQIWIQKGLDMSWPEEQIRIWVRDTIIKSLRETNLREQMERQKLLKLTVETAMSELELKQQIGHVVDIDYLNSCAWYRYNFARPCFAPENWTEGFHKIVNLIQHLPHRTALMIAGYLCRSAGRKRSTCFTHGEQAG